MYVKPKPDRQVPDPERGGFLPESGAHVPENQYWLRREFDGDIERADPPAESSKPKKGGN